MALKYELHGNGPRKVLVTHNWMATLRSYDAVRPALDDTAASYAFIDLRGYGLNRERAGDHTAQEAARDLIDVADQLGWQRFHVLGHSMSGMVAQRVCVEAHERVQSLIAVTPVSAAGMPLDADATALFTAATHSDEPWLAIARMMTSSRLPERWYQAQLRHFRANVEPRAALGYLRMFSTTNFAEQMTGLAMPALAVVGRHDFMAFTEDAIRSTLGRWLPSLTVQVIESAGHHPMLETPPYFARVVEDFIAAND
jgi:pimeloyl-ACP methyl ester carboxylesterase